MGWVIDVVSTKKVISKKPRSTIGVRSTLVEGRLNAFANEPFLFAGCDELISAIIESFYTEEIPKHKISIK